MHGFGVTVAPAPKSTSYRRDFIATARAALARRTVESRDADVADDDVDAPSFDPYAGLRTWGDS